MSESNQLTIFSLEAMSTSENAEPVAVDGCPFVNTHDKFQEAHYFISQMVHTYHEPEPLRWNLNAFLQALRSVTFVIKKEFSDLGIKDDWYKKEQEWMRAD